MTIKAAFIRTKYSSPEEAGLDMVTSMQYKLEGKCPQGRTKHHIRCKDCVGPQKFVFNIDLMTVDPLLFALGAFSVGGFNAWPYALAFWGVCIVGELAWCAISGFLLCPKKQ